MVLYYTKGILVIFMRFIDINKNYEDVKALCSINCEFPNKGMIGLVGESGSGKSTFVNLLSGLDIEYEGQIVVDNVDIKSMTNLQRATYRNTHISYIFQDYCLFNNKTVKENIYLLKDIMNPFTEEEYLNVIDKLGLQDKVDCYPDELSGGEQQRVSIARALLKKSDILIADEPTAALDNDNADLIFKLLKEISNDKLVIVISHNLKMINRYVDSYIKLENGRIVENTIDLIEANKIELKNDRKAKISLGYAINNSFSLFSESPKRLAFTTLLIVLAFSLFIAIFSTFDVDKNEVFLSTLYDNDVDFIVCNSQAYKDNDEYYTYQSKYQTVINTMTANYLQDIIGKDTLMIRNNNSLGKTKQYHIAAIKYDEKVLVGKYFESSASCNFSGFVEANEYLSFTNYTIISGRTPQSDDEIVLTDTICYLLLWDSLKFQTGIRSFDDLIGMNIIGKKVVGIVKTNFKPDYYKDFYMELQNGKASSSLMEKKLECLMYNSLDSVVLYNDGYFERNKIKSGSAILGLNYINTQVELYDFDVYFENNTNEIDWLTDNKDTLDENEYIVSTQFLKDFNITTDLNSLKDNNKIRLTYDNNAIIDITILGVIDSTNPVLISNQVTNEYLMNLTCIDSYNGIVISLDKKLMADKLLLNRLDELNLSIQNEQYISINMIIKVYSIINIAMGIISIVLCVICTLLLISYYMELMNKNKRDIGIYSAIGLEYSQISKIYIVFAMIISFLSLVLILGFGLVFSNLYSLLMKSFIDSSISMPGLNIISIVIVFLIFMIVSCLGIMISIRRFSKNNPLDLVRE